MRFTRKSSECNCLRGQTLCFYSLPLTLGTTQVVLDRLLFGTGLHPGEETIPLHKGILHFPCSCSGSSKHHKAMLTMKPGISRHSQEQFPKQKTVELSLTTQNDGIHLYSCYSEVSLHLQRSLIPL